MEYQELRFRYKRKTQSKNTVNNVEPEAKPSRWQTDPDWAHIVKLIWWQQEELKQGPISEEELMRQSSWSPQKFKVVMNRLIDDPDSHVIQNPPGTFSYWW